MPKSVRIAGVLALAIAVLQLVTGYRENLSLLPLALIPLIAGIGILRKRAWSAYGFALFLFAQLLVIPIITIRSGNSTGLSLDLIAGAALILVMIPVFLFAGKSLAPINADRGSPFPWIIVSILLTAPLIFVQAFVIPTGAMENTLIIGDHILAQRFPRPVPARGDMVVFLYPIDRRQTFIKRVIGIPGDRIRLANKVVYRNSVALVEPYAIHQTPFEDPYRDNFPSNPDPGMPLLPPAQEMLKNTVVNGEIVVPAGRYFVLGDNRDNSLDSRYWGFISLSDCIGKPFLIYDSEERSTESIASNQHGSRRMRWERFFKII